MPEECSACAEDGHPVPLALVRHHLAQPWARDLGGREFSFCEVPDCPVVYFATDGVTFDAGALRQPPAYKSGDANDLLCFCFGLSAAGALSGDQPMAYIRERVRKGECACDVLNPSGQCCLGSIGRWKKAHHG